MNDEIQDMSPEDAVAIQRVEAASDGMVVAMALSVARERLGMDTAYVTTIDPTQQTVNALMGDPSSLGLITGTEYPIEQTYCRRVLDGKLPNVIPDTSDEPGVQDLAATETIGAYVGVPVTFSDGHVHGTLCSASHEPRPHLGEPEARFMRALAAIIARRLERGREQDFERPAAPVDPRGADYG